jgi:hypothetical protein
MRAKERIEKKMDKLGIDITIAPATSWIGSLNAAMSWCQGDREEAAKMWAYSYYDRGYKAVVEPTKAYSSLKKLEAAVMASYNATKCFEEA